MNKNNVNSLKDFVEEVNNKFNDFDFIIFTGDNLDKAKSEDLDLFLNTIKLLKVKPYVIAGNHDLFQSHNMSKKYYMTTVQKKLGFYHSHKSNYIFKKGNIVFITMDGVKDVIPAPNGYYRDSELIWLDKKLDKYSNKKVVIFQHFPLLDTKIQSHKLYKRENYELVLGKHQNVIAIISGHYHENREEKIDNIYHIVTKNFSDNNYYKIIEIDDRTNTLYTFLTDKTEYD